jgi:hypothetical protein
MELPAVALWAGITLRFEIQKRLLWKVETQYERPWRCTSGIPLKLISWQKTASLEGAGL